MKVSLIIAGDGLGQYTLSHMTNNDVNQLR